MPIPHSLNYFVDLKSRSMSFPTLFSFFKIFFAILGSWNFHMNYSIGLVISEKKKK